MPSKNRFRVQGDNIEIMRDEWDKMAFVTYREDYYDEITSVTWTEQNGYLHNNNLGYLHRYIASKWYGSEILNAITRDGWVVDHMNNNGFDCQISNLEFLPRRYNIAKGQTVDVEAKTMASRIALSLYKDFTTGLYQITLGFNENVSLIGNQKSLPISALKLLYNSDYRIVINDAEQILLEYDISKKINLQKLNFIDYKYETPEFIEVSPDERNRAFIEKNGQFYFLPGNGAYVISIPYEKGWGNKDLENDDSVENQI